MEEGNPQICLNFDVFHAQILDPKKGMYIQPLNRNSLSHEPF